MDYLDVNNDQKADWQMIVDNGNKDNNGKWLSHYIWFEDLDNDGIFGYVNWDSMKFEGWDHDGRANFYTDYNGLSLMLKVHISTWNIENPEFNWENPFYSMTLIMMVTPKWQFEWWMNHILFNHLKILCMHGNLAKKYRWFK
ncbi:MAG: hypothetical protein R2771_10510 [Saprospiraceae bacterium]